MSLSCKTIKKVNAVIFDWAGTTIDYGCFAPLEAFVQIFKAKSINVTVEEIRLYMGMLKKDHLKQILKLDRIETQWQYLYGNKPGQDTVEELYENFEPMLMEILPDFCEPVPGVLQLMENLRNRGLKIGSTTGYTGKMMDIVASTAKKKGYCPDAIVTCDDLPSGRPEPFMCYQNAIKLDVYPLETIVKVGDTASDIMEGINAGMWSVGVVKGGSELGLKMEEVDSMPASDLNMKCKTVSDRFKSHGAHYVMDSIIELEFIIDDINERLTKGEHPCK